MKASRILVLVAALAVVATACSSNSSSGDTPPDTSSTSSTAPEATTTTAAQVETTTTVATVPDIGKIQVGTIPILGSAPIFIAFEKGYFADQGLDVELQNFPSAGPMIAPLASGALDVGGGQFGVSYINAAGDGFDVESVAGIASQPEGFGAVPLLVRKDLFDSGEITTPAGLEGRKLGINVERGTAEYLAAEALGQAGLTIDDVDVQTLPFPEMVPAFANGAIEAAILPHPLAAKALGEGTVAVLLDGDKITDQPQNGMLYFGQRLLDPANHEIGVRFLSAYLLGIRDLWGDGWKSDENAAILSQYTNVPVPAIQNGVSFYFEPNGDPNIASLEDIQQYHFDRGYTNLEAPLPISDLFDRTMLDEALARVGMFEG